MKSLKNLLITIGLSIVVSGCATHYDTQKFSWDLDKDFTRTQVDSNTWWNNYVNNHNDKYIMAALCQKHRYSQYCKG
ncbi:hypothetical protein [Shewanella indica]|jgi:hypothetical protein|uniref:hypothetical protein n=1 Tax=Shewanella indica TaxID=768528 RepID=UPI0019CED9E1|nr:hypothetical protein [Shewanella indica]BCV38544.1 hypothetical protein TUM17377_38720 [Shewanella chilikensis]GHB17403.1 hypothetical protein GCM10007107_33000 [Shewanella indica]